MAEDGVVTFNDAELQRILNSAAMRAEVMRVCNAIMARARATAPVGKTGQYASSFQVRLVAWKKYRVVGYVENVAPHAAAVELRRGVLTRAKRAR